MKKNKDEKKERPYRSKSNMEIIKKSCIRNWLVIGIILLFVGTNVMILGRTQNIQKKLDVLTTRQTIIVDNEGDGDYTSISAAVKNATNGDSIEVYSGTYSEGNIIEITKQITLEGKATEYGTGTDTGLPIIKSSFAFKIFSNNVSITNFQIDAIGDSTGDGIEIGWINEPGVSNVEISNTTINGFSTGIIVDTPTYIKLPRTTNVRLIQNNLINNKIGIEILRIHNGMVEITKNNFINNTRDTRIIGFIVPTLFTGSKTVYSANYWDSHKTTFPKIIVCSMYNPWLDFIRFPWFFFDKTPNAEPN